MSLSPDILFAVAATALSLLVFFFREAYRAGRRAGYDRGFSAGNLRGRREEREQAESPHPFDWRGYMSRSILLQAMRCGPEWHATVHFDAEGFATKMVARSEASAVQREEALSA